MADTKKTRISAGSRFKTFMSRLMPDRRRPAQSVMMPPAAEKSDIMFGVMKCYNTSEDYVETATAIPEVVDAFKRAGYKGYLSTEYEGGEHLRADCDVDSIEQVRRHQEALRRAIEG